LKPGEEKEVVFLLDKRAFAYYDEEIKDWRVESGEFEILVGKSSRNIVLRDRVYVKSTTPVRRRFHRNSTIGDIMEDAKASEVLKLVIQKFLKISEKELDSFIERVKYVPLRALIVFSRGAFTEDMLDELLQKINSNTRQ
jgi:beta-glucosidase